MILFNQIEAALKSCRMLLRSRRYRGKQKMNKLKRNLGQLIFMGRWLQAPLYFGLIFILAAYLRLVKSFSIFSKQELNFLFEILSPLTFRS